MNKLSKSIVLNVILGGRSEAVDVLPFAQCGQAGFLLLQILTEDEKISRFSQIVQLTARSILSINSGLISHAFTNPCSISISSSSSSSLDDTLSEMIGPSHGHSSRSCVLQGVLGSILKISLSCFGISISSARDFH